MLGRKCKYFFCSGHYKVPDNSLMQLQITGRSDAIISPPLSQFNGSKMLHKDVTVQTDQTVEDTQTGWLTGFENKVLTLTVAALVVSVAAMFFYIKIQVSYL